VSNTHNDRRSGWLPMVVTLGSGDSDTFTFDTNTGRMSQYKAAIGTGGSSLTGNLTWNGNGSLAQLGLIALIVLIACSVAGRSQPVGGHQATVRECAQATNTRPRIGVQYRGYVKNEDYSFSARIPSGLTAWGGVANDAPFHGFTIFLDPSMKSCIVFEVHLRVDQSDAPEHQPAAKALQLGGARAWQTTEEGPAHGLALTNVRTVFSLKRPSQTDDGEILLIAPSSELREAKRKYETFLHSVKLGQ